MKKLLLGFLGILTVFIFMQNTYSLETEIIVDVDSNEELILFEDGSYLTIELIVDTPSALKTSLLSNQPVEIYKKAGVKDVKMHTDSGDLLWSYRLYAEFMVTDATAVYASLATHEVVVNGGTWSFSDGSASVGGNTAYGKGKFQNKIWFVTVKTVNIDITLICDIYGNIH